MFCLKQTWGSSSLSIIPLRRILLKGLKFKLNKMVVQLSRSLVCRKRVPRVFPCWHICWAKGFTFGMGFCRAADPRQTPLEKTAVVPRCSAPGSWRDQPPARLSQPKPGEHDPSCLCDYHNKYSHSLYFLQKCISLSFTLHWLLTASRSSEFKENKRAGHNEPWPAKWLSRGLNMRYY